MRWFWAVASLGGLVLALGAGEAVGQAPLKVAAFECDVTPPKGGHPIIWLTPVETVEDPLLAKGVVLDDGRGRYVLCAIDWCGLSNSSHRLFREKIAEAAETRLDRVALQAVHQHTAPYTDGDAQRLLDQTEDPPKYVDFAFLDEVAGRLAAAVRASIERFEPFDRVGVGAAEVEQVASSRRVAMPDGAIRVRWSRTTDPELRAADEGRIDPMLRTITLARGDRPLVRLHYYATHPQSFYGDARASSDVPGLARRRLEKREGVPQVYFTGCAGDVTMGKYNDGSPEARDQLTERLYAGMEAAVAATTYHPAEKLDWRTTTLVLPRRDDPGHALDDHRTVMADPAGDPVRRVLAANCAAFIERSDRPFELSVLEVGPASVLHLPGECMVEFQLFAQRLRGERFVAVAAYGDLAPGYVCTEPSFAQGGYEPSASRAGPGAERALKAAIEKLLP